LVYLHRQHPAVLTATGRHTGSYLNLDVRSHNAVGLIFTPIGLAIAYYFIPEKTSNAPAP
jgi:hypothetical protein